MAYQDFCGSSSKLGLGLLTIIAALQICAGSNTYPSVHSTLDRPWLLLNRVRRGSAYAGGYNDFSGVAKQSTFAALGSYGGFLQTSHAPAGGYSSSGSGAGGISVPNALGTYGQYVPGAHQSPTVLSSGDYGQGGLLFGKI